MGIVSSATFCLSTGRYCSSLRGRSRRREDLERADYKAIAKILSRIEHNWVKGGICESG